MSDEIEECPCRAYDDDPDEDDTCFCGHHMDEHESLAESRSFSAECLVGRKKAR